MIEIRETERFAVWLAKLKDQEAKARIVARIRRLAFRDPGDVAPVGGGLSEMRIHLGAGYRVYFMRRGERFIVLLCGGDKSSQSRDIQRAKQLAALWKD